MEHKPGRFVYFTEGSLHNPDITAYLCNFADRLPHSKWGEVLRQHFLSSYESDCRMGFGIYHHGLVRKGTLEASDRSYRDLDEKVKKLVEFTEVLHLRKSSSFCKPFFKEITKILYDEAAARTESAQKAILQLEKAQAGEISIAILVEKDRREARLADKDRWKARRDLHFEFWNRAHSSMRKEKSLSNHKLA